MKNRVLSAVVLLAATGAGLWAFLAPFFQAPAPGAAAGGVAGARAQDAPWLFVVLLGLCLVVVVSSLEARRTDARLLAVLGLLVGLNATLRLVSGPAGLSGLFFLPILCGFVFGADFGFLLGALSTLVSGLLVGGVGPWLPFQMFAAGWGGMAAGWLPRLPGRLPGRERWEAAVLALWGGISGFAFGAVMNLWFWPFLAAPQSGAAGTWEPGLGLVENLGRYLAFYLATSLWWDAGRALGNVAFLLLAGPAVLRLLRRFHRRLRFEVLPGPAEP